MKIFISYSSQDVEKAQRIAAQLRQENFLVLRDQEFIEGGQPFNLRIQQVLRASDTVLLLLTKAAAASHWVNEELNEALSQGKRLVPIKLEAEVEPPFGTRTLQWIDFSTNEQWELNYPRLVEELRRAQESLRKSSPAPVPKENSEVAPGNPFIVGPRVKPSLFSGRERALRTVIQRVAGEELQSISIVANRRMGKTSLLAHLQNAQGEQFPKRYSQWAFVYIDMQSARARTVKGFMRAMRASLVRDLPDELHELLWKEERDGVLTSLEESIEELRAEEVAIVVLLDEWEEVQAHIELNEVVDSLRTLINAGHMAAITATAHELNKLYEVSRQFMSNAGKRPTDTSQIHPLFTTTYLGLMPTAEWQAVITDAFGRGQRDLRASDLRVIGELAGGNPLLTQMAGSLLWESLDEGWGEAELRARFVAQAEQTFRDWWHKEYVEHQQETLRHVLGLPFAHDPAPSSNILSSAISQLKLRGLLDEAGNVFARPFADFIFNLPR